MVRSVDCNKKVMERKNAPSARRRDARHGRACPGHPRLAYANVKLKTWMPGTRPGMTV